MKSETKRKQYKKRKEEVGLSRIYRRTRMRGSQIIEREKGEKVSQEEDKEEDEEEDERQ